LLFFGVRLRSPRDQIVHFCMCFGCCCSTGSIQLHIVYLWQFGFQSSMPLHPHHFERSLCLQCIRGCDYVSPSRHSRIFLLVAATRCQKNDNFQLTYLHIGIINLCIVSSKLKSFTYYCLCKLCSENYVKPTYMCMA